MGREVRRVPATWEHPKRGRNEYIPLLGDSFSQEAARWDEENERWNKGYRRDYLTDGWKEIEDGSKGQSFEEWTGERPNEKDYMPDWPVEERTHYQMYENTSEGTPISPVMESAEKLARWLADNKASFFADCPAPYEKWLAIIVGEDHGLPVMSVRTGEVQ